MPAIFARNNATQTYFQLVFNLFNQDIICLRQTFKDYFVSQKRAGRCVNAYKDTLQFGKFRITEVGGETFRRETRDIPLSPRVYFL